MEFDYEPLEPYEIRLLKIRPRAAESQSLSFDIVNKSLDSKPRYHALSYAWGLPGDTQTIQLNGTDFLIQRNLHAALRQLEQSQRLDSYLWVDAICINQSKKPDALQELSIQITLMREIYERAAQVLVWLGEPENETNNRMGFEMMKYFQKRLFQVQKKGRPYRPWWIPRAPRTVGQDQADFLLSISAVNDKRIFDVPGTPTHKGWQGIVSLWKSPWWSRTWVFQEATIPQIRNRVHISGIFYMKAPPPKVLFICGDQGIGWTELEATSLTATAIAATPNIDATFLVGANKLYNKLSTVQMLRSQNVLRSFLGILQLLRHTKCHDPRDKVYAPLCLAPDDARNYIKPDYNRKNVLDVYMDVVRYYLAQPKHNLDFLGHAMFQAEEQTVYTPEGIKSVLPSWVPNFSSSLELVPIPKILYPAKDQDKKEIVLYDKRGLMSFDEGPEPPFNPLGDIMSTAFIEDNILHVSGVHIDILKDIILNTGPDLEAIRAAARVKTRQWAVKSKQSYFTGETYQDAVCRTVLMDIVYDEYAKPCERGNRIDNELLRKPRAELSMVEYRYQMNMRVAQINASALRNLGFSGKKLLLMIPNTAVIGDSIWALAGGRALYILRLVEPNTRQYRYIGECYVHGLMDGDIRRRLRLKELTIEEIHLV